MKIARPWQGAGIGFEMFGLQSRPNSRNIAFPSRARRGQGDQNRSHKFEDS
jgi:hypothetical protein